MNKQEFIDWLNNESDDIQIFKTDKDNYDCIDVKIFTKSKDDKFIEQYFAP